MATTLHPDKASPSMKDATQKMQEVNQAFDVLNDGRDRLYYDATGRWPPPNVADIVNANINNYKEIKAWFDIQETQQKWANE